MSHGSPFEAAAFLQRTLAGFAQAVTSLAAAVPGFAGRPAPGSAALQASLEQGYRQLFGDSRSRGIAGLPPSPSMPAAAVAWPRYQAAATRWAEVVSGIAQDASQRFANALEETGPDTPPITSLAELQSLWIDCGEAAYAEAARRDEFAAAQAELLMSLVELSARP